MQPELEPLSPSISVFAPRTHRFNIDAILLAYFVIPKRGERCADFGTGYGTIPLIWLAQYEPTQICRIEIQSDTCELVWQSVKHCGVADRLQVLNLDLRQLDQTELRDSWPENCNPISHNPPYKTQGTGIENPEQDKYTAWYEETCIVKDVARVATSCLYYGGRPCLCQRPKRLTDILTTLCANGLEPRRLWSVQTREGKAPKLPLLQARKNGQPGGPLVESPLILHNEDGTLTREILEIYNDYREGH